MPSQATLAILWIVKAVVELLTVIVLAGFFGLMGLFPLMSGEREGVLIGSAFVLIGLMLCILFSILTIPTIIIGVGFWRGSTWGKIGILILAALNLLHMPIGTLLAVLTFVSLKGEFGDGKNNVFRY